MNGTGMNGTGTALTVRVHDELLAVGMDQDSGVTKGAIYGSITTHAGTTVVCPYQDAGSDAEGPFRALEVVGPLDFSLTGILASLLNPLAAEKISVFTLSTFDTDWILVPAEHVDPAIRALRTAGHTIEEQA